MGEEKIDSRELLQENLQDLLGGGEMGVTERRVQGSWITAMGSLREGVEAGEG